jgi:hypothetical protein
MSNTQQPPAYQPAPQPTYQQPLPTKSGNGLGLAALIVGGIALVGSFIPFLNYATGVIAIIGLVLGIIALFLKGRSKGLAIAGTIVSFLAMILSIILAIVYTSAFIVSVDDAVSVDPPAIIEEGEAAPAPESQGDESTSAEGTRESPVPFGSTVTISTFEGPVWEVVANAPTLAATDQIKAANAFNADPAPGNQYAILPVSATYLGEESGRPFDLAFTYVSPAGHSYDGAFVVMDGQLSEVDELFAGATGTGNVIIEIPIEGAEQGVWGVSYILSDDNLYFGIGG